MHAATLKRAAEILGGIDALRAHLGVSHTRLAAWLRGNVRPPSDKFLRAVDVIVEHEVRRIGRRNGDSKRST
jgi:DNA-binding transcriptional regulator YdaS (Cro superfamily)